MCAKSWSTVTGALLEIAALLEMAAVEQPRLEAQLLLSHCLQSTRSVLLAQPNRHLSEMQCMQLRALAMRRARREPLQYLISEVVWRDFTLRVNRHTLIPRPETELLCTLAIEAAVDGLEPTGALHIADVGTGSGALAIALAIGLPNAQISATDCSAGALRLAARNAQRLAPGRIRFRQCDLASGLTDPLDMVVSNLPYIPVAALKNLAPELAYEPRIALDGGGDGYTLFERLFEQLYTRLAGTATVLLETGHDQAQVVAAMGSRQLGAQALIHRDYGGIERFVCLRR